MFNVRNVFLETLYPIFWAPHLLHISCVMLKCDSLGLKWGGYIVVWIIDNMWMKKYIITIEISRLHTIHHQKRSQKGLQVAPKNFWGFTKGWRGLEDVCKNFARAFYSLLVMCILFIFQRISLVDKKPFTLHNQCW